LIWGGRFVSGYEDGERIFGSMIVFYVKLFDVSICHCPSWREFPVCFDLASADCLFPDLFHVCGIGNACIMENWTWT
jgi:hypothetical protein